MLKRILFSGVILLILLCVLEVILSFIYDYPEGYFIYPPNGEFEFKVNLDYVPGIYDSVAYVKHNSFGARSEELTNSFDHKILAIGGSTTACFALNQDKTWTSLLSKSLGNDYWVGNFGRLGNDTNHHILQARELLKYPELANAEYVIFLVGANDFGRFLASPEDYINPGKYSTILSSFATIPDSELPLIRRLTLFKILRQIKQNLLQLRANVDYGDSQYFAQQMRQNAPKIDTLPKIDTALRHYSDNLKKIITIVKSHNMTPVFVTQPSMWKPNLDDNLERLLLTGGTATIEGTNTLNYYSTEVLYKGMKQFNNTLLKICNEQNVPSINLADQLPKSTEVFYDDCHFNENGAQLVADVLSQVFKRQILSSNSNN
ncbi:SGNH/GDSL hydrolase family protein [Roseivirga pacifica]|uniref:SGNH/GDSL hydrolase family protein n=1 Tax=Roseivirga pacifica TaxID=1267423 RepID=UPI0020946399|nr:SGNH/GDSL hydrolase family protein [Roseivirga pacifica]MCO6359825.1 SGNH/GDSL hydrolase family protein [Roseivirga pacifica]MCO6367195.1 SGNH/GDSL hydrolase family protein [Roseivirga pacifica]MCO6370273.1 SGNH/GDSL hydrolase family protein [Roseivirga pacifica]MCO6374852.1 SGNH/GDSL hydrolase family protein [Roseivirga pacifica]MCO6380110.1 SGNH/GDSL hydrolase family protein [Roseivirga pacifica]